MPRLLYLSLYHFFCCDSLSLHPLPLPFAGSLVNYSTQSTTSLASLATACKWVSHANYISISCLPLLPLPSIPPLSLGTPRRLPFLCFTFSFCCLLLLLAWLCLSKNYAQSRVDWSSVANEDAASFVDHLLQSLKVSTLPLPSLLLPAPDILLPAFLSPPPHLSVYFACLAVYVALLVD